MWPSVCIQDVVLDYREPNTMKTMILSGSRNPQGQTAQAVNALVEGLRDKGAETELVFLPTKNIERCRQCDDAGWGPCRTEGRCVIGDDFAALVQGIRSANCAVFATPVYFGDLSESLRAFLDRLRRITRQEAGKSQITEKPSVGVCMAGGGGGGAASCAAILEKVLATCGFDVVDMISVRRQNLTVKLAVLATMGKWLAGCPSSKT